MHKQTAPFAGPALFEPRAAKALHAFLPTPFPKMPSCKPRTCALPRPRLLSWSSLSTGLWPRASEAPSVRLFSEMPVCGRQATSALSAAARHGTMRAAPQAARRAAPAPARRGCGKTPAPAVAQSRWTRR